MKTRLASVLGLTLFTSVAGAQALPDASQWPEEAALHARRGEFFTAAMVLERPASELGARASLDATRDALTRLRAAVPVRAALGDDEGAARDADVALELGGRSPALRSEAYAVVEAAGLACEGRASRAGTGYLECGALYERALDLFDAGGGAPLDVRVRARVALGRTSAALGDAGAAHARRREAVSIYRVATREPLAPDAALGREEPYYTELAREPRRREREERARRDADCARHEREYARRGLRVGCALAERGIDDAPLRAPTYEASRESELLEGGQEERARAAVAEARLALAREALHRLARTAPRYAGPMERRAYDAWAARVLLPHSAERRRELEAQISDQFRRAIEMHVGPTEALAAADLAGAFLEFATQLRSTVPPEPLRSPWAHLYEDRGCPDHAQRFIDVAQQGFTVCALEARRGGDAEPLAVCERALARIDRRAHPLPDELVPALLRTR